MPPKRSLDLAMPTLPRDSLVYVMGELGSPLKRFKSFCWTAQDREDWVKRKMLYNRRDWEQIWTIGFGCVMHHIFEWHKFRFNDNHRFWFTCINEWCPEEIYIEWCPLDQLPTIGNEFGWVFDHTDRRVFNMRHFGYYDQNQDDPGYVKAVKVEEAVQNRMKLEQWYFGNNEVIVINADQDEEVIVIEGDF